jgi:hypothetical protein
MERGTKSREEFQAETGSREQLAIRQGLRSFQAFCGRKLEDLMVSKIDKIDYQPVLIQREKERPKNI